MHCNYDIIRRDLSLAKSQRDHKKKSYLPNFTNINHKTLTSRALLTYQAFDRRSFPGQSHQAEIWVPLALLMSLPGGAGHLDLAHCGALAGCVGSKLHSQSIASDENLPCISGDVSCIYEHKYRHILYYIKKKRERVTCQKVYKRPIRAWHL